MQQDKIYLNGHLTSWNECDLDPRTLASSNYVYATINTTKHKPLHLPRKLQYALDSYTTLYGSAPELQATEVAEQIGSLLHYGVLPECGNLVQLMLLPNGEGGSDVILSHLATTPYEGYAVQYLRPTAAIANYEIALESHHTAVSLSAAQFADGFATRNKADMALRSNRRGVITSSGDYPLFALKGNTLITTPIESGGKRCVERELVFELCRMARVKIEEEEVLFEQIESYDELFVFSPVGIKSVSKIGGLDLHNITASALEPHLKKLTLLGLEL